MGNVDRRGLFKAGGVLGAGGLLATVGVKAAEAAGIVQVTKTANYTLQSSDADSVIQFDTKGPVTLTIPSTAGPVGMNVEVCQVGAGQVRIVGSGGVVIDSSASLTTRVRYSTLSLRKRGSGRWLLSGDST
jgi:hypothetical protein